jgi:hypothetical protein
MKWDRTERHALVSSQIRWREGTLYLEIDGKTEQIKLYPLFDKTQNKLKMLSHISCRTNCA